MQRKTYIETGVLFEVIGTGEVFHSFRDLNLILAPFVLPPAKPKIDLLEIEGMDGSLDLTEANGEIKYNDRELKFTFTVFPQDDLTFEERQTAVSNALNGQRCKITLGKDADYYLIGRCTVNDHLCDRRLCQIVVTATVAPYKLLQNETVASFSLTNAAQTVILVNRRKSVVPTITVTASANVTFGNVTVTLEAGTHKVLDFQLKQGNNDFVVTGTGTIQFSYQEGDL